MGTPPQHRTSLLITRAAFITLLIAILGIAGLRLLLRSGWMLERIRTEAMAALPGLRIDHVDGDAWTHLEIVGIAYADSTADIRIDTLRVGYSVWPLLTRTIDLRHLHVHGLRASIRTMESNPSESQSPDWPNGSFRLRSLRLVDATIGLNGIRYLDGLNLLGSASIFGAVANRRFDLSMNLSSEGIRQMEIDLRGDVGPGPVLRDIRIRSNGLDLPRLLQDPDLPQIGSAHATLSGHARLQALDSMSLTGTIGMDGIRVGEQLVRSFESQVRLQPDSLLADGRILINRVPVQIALASNGWRPESEFRLSAATAAFDLRDLSGFDQLPSSLNATFLAYGQLRQFTAQLEIRHSTLNRAPIQEVSITAHVGNEQLTIHDARIRSAIIDGQLTARYGYAEANESENRLDAEIRLIDLQPLASLIGVDSLHASGTLRARMERGSDRLLRLRSNLRFDAARIDGLTTGPIVGEALVEWAAQPTLDLGLRVERLGYTDPIARHADLRLVAEMRPNGLSGRYQLEADFERPLSLRHAGVVNWSAETLTVTGERLDILLDATPYRIEQPFQAVYSPKGWGLSGFELAGESGVRALLDMVSDGTSVDASGHILEADLMRIRAWLPSELPVSGRASIHFDGSIRDGQPRFDAHLRLSDLRVRDVDTDSLLVRASLADQRLTIAGSAHQSGDEWLEFTGSVPFRFEAPDRIDPSFFEEPVSGRFRMNPTSLPGEPVFTGTLITAATLGGTAGQPEFNGRLDLLRGTLAGVPVDSLGMEWTYSAEARQLDLTSEWRSLDQTALMMQGTIPFSMDMRTFRPVDVTDQPLQIRMSTRAFDLGAFNSILDPGIVRRLTGRLDGDIHIDGTLATPQLDGSMHLRNGSVTLPTPNITVRDITAEARFTPGRIELVHFRANSNGRLEATGWLAMNGFSPGPFTFSLSGQNLRVADTRNLQMFCSIQAMVSGTVDAPTATGRISLERGSIHLEEFGETQVETVRLDNEAASWLDGLDLYRQLTLDMQIRTDRNVWFRNRSGPEMQMELKGDLQLVKSPGGDALVFGTMGTRQGHLSQLGKRFTLETGELVFHGDPMNPALHIRTAYVLRPPHDITIRYRIGGTVGEPTFGYESEPQMELQDMVSYTLFNRPFNALMSWEQSMTNQGSLGTMAMDLLTDRVGEFAAGALGLDVVQIDNSRSSGNSGMTIKAGSFVNDKLFIAILQEFGGTSDSQVIMEYALRQNLNVVLTGSDRRKSGIDIQWTYDY
jgi:hypothetical protein